MKFKENIFFRTVQNKTGLMFKIVEKGVEETVEKVIIIFTIVHGNSCRDKNQVNSKKQKKERHADRGTKEKGKRRSMKLNTKLS